MNNCDAVKVKHTLLADMHTFVIHKYYIIDKQCHRPNLLSDTVTRYMTGEEQFDSDYVHIKETDATTIINFPSGANNSLNNTRSF